MADNTVAEDTEAEAEAYVEQVNQTSILAQRITSQLNGMLAMVRRMDGNHEMVAGRYEYWKEIAKGIGEEIGFPPRTPATGLRPAVRRIVHENAALKEEVKRLRALCGQ